MFEQYDCLVGSRTVRRPEQADAAVLRLALDDVETDRAIAVSIDGNGRRVACDPYVGAAEAVCECAANLACVGAEPLGLTNCLNFGNPEKPHVAWQLTRAVEGLAAACRALEVPVVGGNVSLYNEGPEGPIYPTPVVGMVGELPDVRRAPGRAPSRAARTRWSRSSGRSPRRCSARSWRGSRAGSRAARTLRPAQRARGARGGARAVRAGAVTSAHDVSDGGLRLRGRECAIAGGVGADARPRAADAPRGGRRAHGAVRRGPGGVVVSGPREALLELERAGGRRGLPGARHGGRRRGIAIAAGAATIEVSLEDARSLFESALAERLS